MSNCGGGGGGGGVGSISVSAGDWICPDIDCRHLNFARRLQCNKCNRDRESSSSSSLINEKPDRDRDRDRERGSSSSSKKKLGTEIGKVAADKSRGLFSAEDWQCSKCANVNWARRQTCNMCNAPKFTDVEERTGFGGGYNDRGVVEYKERQDSDSEYDEFGRRKKRKTHEDGRSREDPKRARRSDIEGDEDDDDDEDDDGDLSKYDLWGDNEVTSSNVKSKDSMDNGNSKEKSSAAASASTAANNSKRASRDSTSSTSSSSTSSSSSSSDTSSTSSTSNSSSCCSSNASNSKRTKKRSSTRSRSTERIGSGRR